MQAKKRPRFAERAPSPSLASEAVAPVAGNAVAVAGGAGGAGGAGASAPGKLAALCVLPPLVCESSRGAPTFAAVIEGNNDSVWGCRVRDAGAGIGHKFCLGNAVVAADRAAPVVTGMAHCGAVKLGRPVEDGVGPIVQTPSVSIALSLNKQRYLDMNTLLCPTPPTPLQLESGVEDWNGFGLHMPTLTKNSLALFGDALYQHTSTAAFGAKFSKLKGMHATTHRLGKGEGFTLALAPSAAYSRGVGTYVLATEPHAGGSGGAGGAGGTGGAGGAGVRVTNACTIRDTRVVLTIDQGRRAIRVDAPRDLLNAACGTSPLAVLTRVPSLMVLLDKPYITDGMDQPTHQLVAMAVFEPRVRVSAGEDACFLTNVGVVDHCVGRYRSEMVLSPKWGPSSDARKSFAATPTKLLSMNYGVVITVGHPQIQQIKFTDALLHQVMKLGASGIVRVDCEFETVLRATRKSTPVQRAQALERVNAMAVGPPPIVLETLVDELLGRETVEDDLAASLLYGLCGTDPAELGKLGLMGFTAPVSEDGGLAEEGWEGDEPELECLFE